MPKLNYKDFFKIPNLLSFYRLLISFIIPGLWIKNPKNSAILYLIISGVLSDTLDGNLARLLKQKTSIGKFLDPLADKCFINMLFFLLFLQRKLSGFFFIIILLRDLFILLGSFLLLQKFQFKFMLSPTILGKASTVSQLITLITLYIHFYLMSLNSFLITTILSLTLVLTLLSGFHYGFLFVKFWRNFPIR